jgi:hypothetical protein
MNGLAQTVGVEAISTRSSATKVRALYETLCTLLDPPALGNLSLARDEWLKNGGGGDLHLELLDGTEANAPEDDADTAQLLYGHKHMQQSFYGAKQPFRLQSRAFMLTFNSLRFVLCLELWASFLSWIKLKVSEFKASEWSATLEESLQADEKGRVHFHAYLSWTKPGLKGIDHRSTDAWVFQHVRPRIDKNTEARGPQEWLRSVQHGHFYVSVEKKGTLYTETNDAPWLAGWAPEPWWVTKLWRLHKLDHAQYKFLSTQLREGHDRRNACLDAVKVAESSFEFLAEQEAAREAVSARAFPFKPLTADVERWIMHYEEISERYKMLILHGPSRTGKSRLARSLFGDKRTLVVDVQHADHPDLRGYRRRQHRAILLDEVSSLAFIVANKKLLQAHVDGAILGQSSTQLFSYAVFLWRVPIILTTNNWDMSGLKEHEKDWIRANCVPVCVSEPVWVEGPVPAHGPGDVSDRASKRRAQSCSACGQRLPAVS